MKKTTIGGQAVMEGVMMKAPEGIAIAVRHTSGNIVTQYIKTQNPAEKHKWMGWPVIRGVVNFIVMLKLGMDTTMKSAEMIGLEEEIEKPSRFETFLAKKTGKSAQDVMMFFAVALAIVLSVGLFVVLPSLLTGLLRQYVASAILMNAMEGLVRLLLFLSYVILISRMKDIRRVFMYHGAEHKTIACYEHEMELTASNAMAFSRLHPRCGTNFLLLTVAVSVLIFSIVGWSGNAFLRILVRLAMMPLVAGVAYEVLRFASRSDNIFCRAVRFPGMMLQKLTTREPEPDMIDVAITAFNLAINKGVCDSQVDADVPLQVLEAVQTPEVTQTPETSEAP